MMHLGHEPQSPKLVIGQVIETLQMGGAENLALRIANELARQGHESHLIILGSPGILSSKVSSAVKVHYLEYTRASIKNPFAFISSLLKGYGLFSRTISENGIQVIQTHLPGANFWGLLAAMKKLCRTLATVHNNKEFDYGENGGRIRIRLRKQAYRLMFKYGAGIVTVSAEVKASLLKELGFSEAHSDQVLVVDNGVSIPEPLDSVRIGAIKKELGIHSDRPLILSAGRFSEQKNFSDLLKAAALLKEKNSSFQLLICGDGEQRADLERMVSKLDLRDQVLMPGNLTNLDEVMLAADIFCMSSLWEGLPLVLLEAMAAGLPVVGYDIKGIDEIVVDGVQGLIAPTGDPAGLAKGLSQLLENQADREKMGSAGKSLIEEKYNFVDLVERLVGKYGEVVRN